MPAVDVELGLSATIDGSPLGDLVSVSCSGSVEGRNSQCTIVTASSPGTFAPAADVQVSVSVNGDSALLYRGDYVGRPGEFDGGTRFTVQAVGLLARLQRPWGGEERVYSADLADAERVDAAVIRNLIEAYGIPSSRHRIFESEWNDLDNNVEHWLLGEIQPVVLNPGEPAIKLIDLINEPPRFAIYDQLTGFLDRTRHNTHYAHPTATYSFAQGQDGVRIRRLGPAVDLSRIVNRAIYTGLTTFGIQREGGFEASSALLDAFYPPELRPAYHTQTYHSDLLESDHYCQQAAALAVGDLNRAVDGWEIVLQGHPDQHKILLQDTIAVSYGVLDGGGGSRHRVISLSHEVTVDPPAFVTTLITNGGTLV